MKPQYLLRARDDFRSAKGELKRLRYEQRYWEYDYVVWTEEDIIAWERKCRGVNADGSDDQLLESEQANAVAEAVAKFIESMEPFNAARKSTNVLCGVTRSVSWLAALNALVMKTADESFDGVCAM